MKSNKKLFAILTLVVFMMTLLPMSAFAVVDRFSTKASIDKTSVVADDSDYALITVYTYSSATTVSANEYVYVATTRNMALTRAGAFVNETIYDGGAGDFSYDTNGWALKTDATAKGELKVKSALPGTTTIALSTVSAEKAKAYLEGGTNAPTASAAGIIGTYTVTFTSASASTVSVASVAYNTGATKTTMDFTNAVNQAIDGGTSARAYAGTAIKGNSTDYFELSFKVATAAGVPVSDQEVTFSYDKTGARFSATTVKTDVAGIAKVKVYGDKAGTYKIKGQANDKSKEVYVTFGDNAAYNVELISANNQKVAQSNDFILKFKLLDVNGNMIDYVGAGRVGTTVKGAYNIAAGAIAMYIDTVTKPSGSNMDDKITDNANAADYVFDATAEGYLQMTIDGAELNKEGAHAVKLYFDSGKSITVNFEVKKQGTPVTLEVKYDQTSVGKDTIVGAPTVKRYDADGVSATITPGANNMKFSVSDVRMLAAAIAANGSFRTVNDEKYAGTLIITGVDTEKNLVDTFEMTFAKTANGITLTPAAATTEVGQTATVTMQVVDVDGKSIAVDKDGAAGTIDFYVTGKPAGAVVSTSAANDALTTVEKTGKATLNVSCNLAGNVTVQVVYTDNVGAAAKTFTKDVTLTFGAAKVVEGAKQVTMFIGATGFMKDGTASVTDVAPFIQDGRTFVAVRPVADAFGATIGWNEATQTVTLTRTDRTVTIVIGSNTITTVASGVTTTKTADVPAFIKDGRTVLPFRAVGEAFGATVNYDAATQSVSYQQ